MLEGKESPVEFRSIENVNRMSFIDLQLEVDAATSLFTDQMINTYPNLVNLIIQDCNGMVGALVIAIDEIADVLKHRYCETPSEDYLIGVYLKTFEKLHRCFGAATSYRESVEIRNVITNTHPVSENMIKLMLKCGLINNNCTPVQFTSPLAKRFLYNSLFGVYRADKNPTDLLTLVKYAICSMSNNVLKQSIALDTQFPKEAIFQHLLMGGLVQHTTPSTYVCPEISRIFPEPDSAASLSSNRTRGEIDFFIDGDLRWGIELVVKGSNITEHLERFEPLQKYAPLNCKEYLVVDFRQSSDGNPSNVTRHSNRLTVFFKPNDSSTCNVVIGTSSSEVLWLQN